jgi:glycine dehydrogenase subunit 1
MPYLVHSAEDRRAMLDALGAASMEALLGDVPPQLRVPRIDLAPGLSEFETMARVEALAGRNRAFEARRTFRGGGVYRRFIPAAVDAVISKPEFYTATRRTSPRPRRARCRRSSSTRR